MNALIVDMLNRAATAAMPEDDVAHDLKHILSAVGSSPGPAVKQVLEQYIASTEPSSWVRKDLSEIKAEGDKRYHLMNEDAEKDDKTREQVPFVLLPEKEKVRR
jgi:hypothetical protein